MRFEDEQYVRVYKRDTTTWLMLNWQGRCVLPLILRKVDRAGILELGEYGVAAIAAHILVPPEVVEEGMRSILKLKILTLRDDGLLVWPKFIEAQEAKQSDKARQKSARERARDLAEAAARGVNVVNPPPPTLDEVPNPPSTTPRPHVTPRDLDVTPRDLDVTPRDITVTRGHTASRGVTLSSAQLSSAKLSPAEGEAAPPASGEQKTHTQTAVGQGGPPRPNGVPKGVIAMHRAAFVAAYVTAVREVTGVVQWTMPPFGGRDLEVILENWCTGPERGDPEAWLTRTVRAFAETNPTAFDPSRVLRFLNDTAISAKRAQPPPAPLPRLLPPLPVEPDDDVPAVVTPEQRAADAEFLASLAESDVARSAREDDRNGIFRTFRVADPDPNVEPEPIDDEPEPQPMGAT